MIHPIIKVASSRVIAALYRKSCIAAFSCVLLGARASSNVSRRWSSSTSGQGDSPHRSSPSSPYSIPTLTDITHFKSIVGEAHVLTDPADIQTASTDWLRQYKGKDASCILRPRTTQEVSKILEYCNHRHIAVVPQGGNTGLVGGSVPFLAGEVILSLSRMKDIVSLDKASGATIVQAGCILQTVDQHLGEHGYMMPLDLGAKGSCQIGGNVSTNAGGLRLLRWGSLHGSVLGIEAVLADGTVLDTLGSGLRKDNVGYDVKQLFIGSEGTLGVVTGVAIQAVPKPTSVHVAMFGLRTFHDCLALFTLAKQNLGEILSAVEFVDHDAMNITLHTLFPQSIPATAAGTLQSRPFVVGVAKSNDDGSGDSGDMIRSKDPSQYKTSTTIDTGVVQHHWDPAIMPLSRIYPFHVVIETAGSNVKHDEEKLTSFLDICMERQVICDGVVADSIAKAKHLWRLREDVSVAISQRGYVFKYDLSFKHAAMFDIVEEMRARLASKGWLHNHNHDTNYNADLGIIPVGYGHLGDGNLHLNISTKGRNQDYLEALRQDIEPFVYKWTLERGGSISAEHGVGQAKSNWLDAAKSPAVAHVMRSLKKTLDPKGILNPGKVIPL